MKQLNKTMFFPDSSADNSSTAAHQSTSFFAVEEDLLVDPFSGSSYTQNTASELDLFANASPIQPISTSSTSLHKNPDLLTDLMGSTSIGEFFEILSSLQSFFSLSLFFLRLYKRKTIQNRKGSLI